jgi:hypothetical protein
MSEAKIVLLDPELFNYAVPHFLGAHKEISQSRNLLVHGGVADLTAS